MNESNGNSTNARAPVVRETRGRSSGAEPPVAEHPPRQPEVRGASELPATVVAPTAAEPAASAAGVEPSPLSWFERAPYWPWLLLSGAVVVVLLLIGNLVSIINALAAWHWALAAPLVLLAAAFALLASLLGIREIRRMRKLAGLTELARQGEALADEDGHGGAVDYIRRVKQRYANRQDVMTALGEFERHSDVVHSDRDNIERLSVTLGAALDRQAQRVIARQVRQIGMFSVVNPIALLESAVTLWLCLRMIRGVARVYGGEPGLIASWRLTREVAVLAAAAGVADVVADHVTDAVGTGLARLISGKLAQGALTGLLVARIGLYTMRLCRPIPLGQQERSLWQALRKEVFSISQEQVPEGKGNYL